MFDGPIIPIAIKIGVPTLIGLVLQFCYALIDTIFISRIDPRSTAIISGTGLMFPLFFLFMAISMSMNVGISSMVGRFIGENNQENARHVMPSGLLIGLGIGAPAIFCGYFFSHHFLHFLAGSQLTEEAMGYGERFLNFLLPGLSIMLLGNVFSGILQGEGHTGTIARAMILSTVLNIALDPVLIFGLKMGVAGAGMATSISILSAAFFMCVAFFHDKSSFPFSLNIFNCKWKIIIEIFRIGFPNFLSMASLAVSFMVFNKIVSALDQTVMNAWTLVGRMDQIVMIPAFAVSGSALTMIAQNFGRGNFERIKRIYNRVIVVGVLSVGAVALVYMIAAPLFFKMFTDLPEVVDLASRQVRFLALTIAGLSVAVVSVSSFQAVGKPVPALFLSLIRMGLISIPLALVLVFALHLKIFGVYIALATGNLCAVPIAYFWFRREVKRISAKTSL